MSKPNNIKIIIYDKITRQPIESLSRTQYKKRVLEIIKNILEEKESLKQRGSLVVKEDCIEQWEKYVDDSLSDLTNRWEDIWYNAVIIAAAVNSMERLNKGLDISTSYRTIDIQEVGHNRIYYNMRLTGWQNYLVTQIVYNYHSKGEEFLQYRNEFVKSPVKMKKKTQK